MFVNTYAKQRLGKIQLYTSTLESTKEAHAADVIH